MSSLSDLARRAWHAVPFWARARLRRVPLVRRGFQRLGFVGSSAYWETRYAAGGTSGAGSYGRLAHFKADFLNDFVRRNQIASVVEFGCGDGNQLSLASYPSYLGLDVATTAIAKCRQRFGDDATKSFARHDAAVDAVRLEAAELSLSLDVVYHLVEDRVFEPYMRHLFASASKWVVVYSSNGEMDRTAPHVRHRKFTDWVEQNAADWHLKARVPNRYPTTLNDGGETSWADFFVFGRPGSEASLAD
jgi:hypothetical protein